MKDFKEFLKEFKELNPKLSRSELEKRAKEAFKEEKKTAKETITIIRVPSIINKEKEEKEQKEEKPKEPEKTPEELAEEKRIKEEKEADEKREKVVTQLMDMWGQQLNRTIEGKAYPQYPIHPITRRLVTPTDLYHVIDAIQNNEMPIEIPALLAVLVSNQKACMDCYRAFHANPVMASERLRDYIIKKNIQFHPELAVWQSPMMPPLRREFITFSKGSCKQFMPLTINLEEELDEEKVIKSPLDEIHSLKELLEHIGKDPEILSKVTDHELQFYGIKTDKAMELRKIAGEKNKKKREKAIKELFKPEKEEQKGGGNGPDLEDNKKVKRDLALYAAAFL